MMRRVLCAWFPRWPLQCLLAARPELTDRRGVVLYEPAPRGAWQVFCCSAEAHARNIRPGMPLAEAQSLVGAPSLRSARSARSAPWHLERYDPVATRAALVALAGWCQQFSPSVGLAAGPHPECLLLDVTGLARLFHGEHKLVELVAEGLGQQGFRARLALADTIGAAWALARYAPRLDLAGGRALRVPAGGSLAAVAPLPLAALRLSAESLGLLGELGLRRIEQLQSLSRADLSTRFGPEVSRRWDELTGDLPEPIVAEEPPALIEAGCALEPPLDRSAGIEAILERELARLVETLAGERRGVQQFVCRLQGAGGANTTFQVGLFRPTAAARHLFELARLKLERLTLSEPVAGVWLRVTATAPLECRQQELFVDRSPRRDPRHLAALVDRLGSRLGSQAVLRARLVSDAQPEYAWHYESLVAPAPRPRRAAPGGRATRRFGWSQRPLRLAREPTPLHVTSVVPDGPPVRFELAGGVQQIVRVWGPERIETGWWRERAVRRDYYQVETTSGQRFWLFRRLADGQWFWHGDFD